MNLYPFYECAATVEELLRDPNKEIFQQFICAHCGAKQTMDTPNIFYKAGTCEECGKETNIEKDGCNYMLHVGVLSGSLKEIK